MLCRATHPLRPRQTRLASRQRLSAAGEGVFTDSAKDPQVVFCRNMSFFRYGLEKYAFSMPWRISHGLLSLWIGQI
ncbi:hypothetical protein N0B44_25065, partial [Roseibacterium beibuensis]